MFHLAICINTKYSSTRAAVSFIHSHFRRQKQQFVHKYDLELPEACAIWIMCECNMTVCYVFRSIHLHLFSGKWQVYLITITCQSWFTVCKFYFDTGNLIESFQWLYISALMFGSLGFRKSKLNDIFYHRQPISVEGKCQRGNNLLMEFDFDIS